MTAHEVSDREQCSWGCERGHVLFFRGCGSNASGSLKLNISTFTSWRRGCKVFVAMCPEDATTNVPNTRNTNLSTQHTSQHNTLIITQHTSQHTTHESTQHQLTYQSTQHTIKHNTLIITTPVSTQHTNQHTKH